MELFNKICKNPKCGKSYTGTRTQQYCCPACRSYAREKEIKIELKAKKPCSLGEASRQARELGMSYGNYVAMQFLEERKKNNNA